MANHNELNYERGFQQGSEKAMMYYVDKMSDAKELLIQSANEIEKIKGEETDLTKYIRKFLNTLH